ncbi:hypothetical protein DPMN_170908 [Dreissena polymorpha]|uniref:Uncharacterized protein n=1 Tax=Dreissena polymorpha TaxID=45954 RepID=A0A9D4E055_DREPO|nr:hypothetical protein DPMN_170908 [Dreissena polymorpha]
MERKGIRHVLHTKYRCLKVTECVLTKRQVCQNRGRQIETEYVPTQRKVCLNQDIQKETENVLTQRYLRPERIRNVPLTEPGYKKRKGHAPMSRSGHKEGTGSLHTPEIRRKLWT